SGMAMSKTTTSGLVASALTTVCRPSAASPTTLNPGWRSSSTFRPARMTLWSSANRMRISLIAFFTLFVGERKFYGQRSAAAGLGTHGALASQARHSLFDAKQAQALAVFDVKSPSVIAYGKR